MGEQAITKYIAEVLKGVDSDPSQFYPLPTEGIYVPISQLADGLTHVIPHGIDLGKTPSCVLVGPATRELIEVSALVASLEKPLDVAIYNPSVATRLVALEELIYPLQNPPEAYSRREGRRVFLHTHHTENTRELRPNEGQYDIAAMFSIPTNFLNEAFELLSSNVRPGGLILMSISEETEIQMGQLEEIKRQIEANGGIYNEHGLRTPIGQGNEYYIGYHDRRIIGIQLPQ